MILQLHHKLVSLLNFFAKFFKIAFEKLHSLLSYRPFSFEVSHKFTVRTGVRQSLYRGKRQLVLGGELRLNLEKISAGLLGTHL